MSHEPVLIRCTNCLSLNRVPREKVLSSPRCGSCKDVLEVPQRPLHVTTANFDRHVAYWPGTLLVEFTSPYCLYCRIFEPAVDELAEQRAGQLKVLKIDIEAEAELTKRFSVAKTPTYLVYKNGVQVVRMDGAPKEKNELITWIDNLINYTSY